MLVGWGGGGGREAEAQEIMEIFLNTTSSSDIMLSDKSIKYCKIKPQGLYFSKALFEGLTFGGAYLRREICIYKSIGLAL